jgi:ABC-type branched-subunit amino acid transport system ATPase component
MTAPHPVRPLVVLMGLATMPQMVGLALVLLLPSIKGSYRIGLFVVSLVVALHAQLGLAIDLPFALFANGRFRMRTNCVLAGLFVSATVVAAITGMARGVILLDFALLGAVSWSGGFISIQNSLLADYYPAEIRARVYYAHRAAIVAGLSLTPVIVGILTRFYGWQVVLLVMVAPTLVFIAIGLTVTEPHGTEPRPDGPVAAAGATAGGDAEPLAEAEAEANGAAAEARAVIETDDDRPTLPETTRVLLATPSLRRIYYSLPFLVAALIGVRGPMDVFYQNVLHQSAAPRSLIFALVQPAAFVGLVAGFVIVQRAMTADPGRAVRLIAVTTAVAGVFLVAFALAPNLGWAVAAQVGFTVTSSWLVAGVYALVSVAAPPRMLTLAFALTTVWLNLGVFVVSPAGLSLAGEAGITFGYRPGMFIFVAVYLIGAAILASAGKSLNRDLERLRLTAVADLEARRARIEGRASLLMVRSLDAGYDGVQVLFGVSLDIADGEMVAILGTNGAGKSTLLRAISGLTVPTAGEVLFDGRDITTTDPDRIVERGILQVPGGRGIFPGLTVAESLRVSGWMYAADPDYLGRATQTVLDYFPILRERWHTTAGSLSGGEQQMLSLAQAFIARPRLLMIDELSLGLAPTVIEALLDIVKSIHANGTTVILVEQSVNLALRLTDRAIFMEKGQVVYSGTTSELLEREDIVRAVILSGGDQPSGATVPTTASATTKGVPAPGALDEVGTRSLASPPTEGPPGVGPAAGGPPEVGALAAPLSSAAPGGPDGPPEVVLSATALRKRFGGIVAVDDVDLELFNGEILGLIGPNGAGKTTVFELISGQLPSDGGHVFMFGQDISAWPAHRRAAKGLGRSFQAARLWPGLTVGETLSLAVATRTGSPGVVPSLLCLPRVSRSERRLNLAADEVLELLGLGDFRDQLASDLSTGTRRLVELAVMVAMKPSILLLDEPSAGIAQAETEALIPVLRQTKERLGCSIMLIEHDMTLMRNLADRIAALDTGAVVVVGPPDDVLNHPRVIESYLGAPAQ